MPSTADIRSSIQARLDEITKEADQLREALANLNGDASEPAHQGATKKELIAAALAEGLTPKEVANKLGVHIQYVYSVRAKESE